jgi:serine/threonine protein kinase
MNIVGIQKTVEIKDINKNISVKKIEEEKVDNGSILYKISDGKKNSIYIDNISKNILLYPVYTKYSAVIIPNNPLYTPYFKKGKKLKIYALSKTEQENYSEPKKNTGNISNFGKIDFYKTEEVAVKHFNPSGTDDLNRDLVLEVAIYKFLEHNCIPEFYGYDISKSSDNLIDIQLGNKTLYDYINEQIQKNIQETPSEKLVRIKPFIKKLLLCFRQIHNFGIIHQDIKPENIVLYNNQNVKIIDWGISTIDNSKDQNYPNGTPGTRGYICPEIYSIVYNNGTYNYKKDIFALGIVFLQLYLNSTSSIIAINSRTDFYKDIDILIKILLGYNYINQKGLQNLNNEIKMRSLIIKLDTARNIKVRLLQQYSNDEKLDVNEKKINDDFFDIISHMLDFNPNTRWNCSEILVKLFGNQIIVENPLKFPSYNNIYYNILNTTGKNIDFYWKKQILISDNGDDIKSENIREIVLKNFKDIAIYINTYFQIKYTIEAFCLGVELLDLYYIMSYYKKRDIAKNYNNTIIQLFAIILISSKVHPYNMKCIDISVIKEKKMDILFKKYNMHENSIQQIIETEKNIFNEFDGNVFIYTFYSYFSKQIDINGKMLLTKGAIGDVSISYMNNTNKIINCLLDNYYLVKNKKK